MSRVMIKVTLTAKIAFQPPGRVQLLEMQSGKGSTASACSPDSAWHVHQHNAWCMSQQTMVPVLITFWSSEAIWIVFVTDYDWHVHQRYARCMWHPITAPAPAGEVTQQLYTHTHTHNNCSCYRFSVTCPYYTHIHTYTHHTYLNYWPINLLIYWCIVHLLQETAGEQQQAWYAALS